MITRSVVLGALVVSGCHAGEPRADGDPIAGAWCAPNGTPVYFHGSFVTDDGELGLPRHWFRDGDRRLRFGDDPELPTAFDRVIERHAPGSVELEWAGTETTLTRAEYLVATDSGGICD